MKLFSVATLIDEYDADIARYARALYDGREPGRLTPWAVQYSDTEDFDEIVLMRIL